MAILTETGAPRIRKNIGWPSSFKPIIPLRAKSNPDFCSPGHFNFHFGV